MRRGPRPAGRAGFTLIELLTVIAILALLAALVAAGIGRVRSGAQGNVTTQALTKLQKALENQWKATCDQCRDDRRMYSRDNSAHPDFKKMVAICDGDVDRAEGAWMYLNLRRDMPHTFAEARTPVVLTAAGQTIVLPLSNTYAEIQKKSGASGDQYTESAALLYLILTKGARGTSFSIEDGMQGAQTSLDFGAGLTLPAFKDGFNTPIAYRRFFQNAEMYQPPYVRAGLSITDPLDPVGRLKHWRTQNVTNYNALAAAVFRSPAPPGGFGSATDFDGFNRMATVISAGANNTLVFPYGFDLSGNTDDAFGYRVLRAGAKAD